MRTDQLDFEKAVGGWIVRDNRNPTEEPYVFSGIKELLMWLEQFLTQREE